VAFQGPFRLGAFAFEKPCTDGGLSGGGFSRYRLFSKQHGVGRGGGGTVGTGGGVRPQIGQKKKTRGFGTAGKGKDQRGGGTRLRGAHELLIRPTYKEKKKNPGG